MPAYSAIALCASHASHETAIAVCTTMLGREPPEWVQLLPLGEIRPREADGRAPWRLRDAQKVVAASAAGIDLVIDYEHQTDYAPKNGQPAPAAGWIKELAVRADGIWGRVEWTERAAAHIRAGEYRYISPVFTHDRTTREVRQIVHAALTNDPAIDVLKAVARKDDNMDYEEFLALLRAALGSKADADADAVVAQCKTLASVSTALTGIRKALGLKDDAPAAEVEAAAARVAGVAGKALAGLGLAAGADGAAVETALAKRANHDPAQFVSKAEYDALQLQVAGLTGERATEKATAKVDAAVKAGKITPAQRDWAIDYATRQPDEFDRHMEKAPVIVAPGTSQPAAKPQPGAALTEDEKAICRLTGVSEDAFKKTRDAELTARQKEVA